VLLEGKCSMRSHSLWDVQVGGGGVGKLTANQLRLFVGIVFFFFFFGRRLLGRHPNVVVL
jgi:hypothetical protein